MPKTITVKGTDAALAAISEVTCETVDLSKVYDDTQIALKPILTDGVDRRDRFRQPELRCDCQGRGDS